MRLIGYRMDYANENNMLLFTHRRQYYLRYKDEDIKLTLSTEIVPKGTYYDDVWDIPYFVLDNRVYPLSSFKSLQMNR